MTAKALRRKKNRKAKAEAKKEKASLEEALLREEALQQLAGGVQQDKQDSPNAEETAHKQRADVNVESADQGAQEVEDGVGKIEIEYANTNEMEELGSSKAYAEFMQVFERFDQQAAAKLEQQAVDASMGAVGQEAGDASRGNQDGEKVSGAAGGDSASNLNGKDKQGPEGKMTKKQRKQLTQMKIFDLKMQVKRPDLVEAWDVTSKDPLFLLECKQVRNSVPVPRHWAQKRRYLQYKRGIHKIPFKLPDFIEQTGISRLREKASQADDAKTLKQKMRERMQPKMGKIEIDYQVLHDAFFKNQKKPKQTAHGDVYFEGKEYEIRMKDFKPGHLSPALRAALGIQENMPPPWLYNMQRYGPPPAYPNLKIPGVNMAMPSQTANTNVGKFFTGENAYTIYADCHGLNRSIYAKRQNKRPHWGTVQETEYEQFGDDESYDSEAELEEEGDHSAGDDQDGLEANMPLRDMSADDGQDLEDADQLKGEDLDVEDLWTGVQSAIQGDQTPTAVQLTKAGAGAEEPQKHLYEVLPEVTRVTQAEGQIFGSSHGYQIPSTAPKEEVDVQEEVPAQPATKSEEQASKQANEKKEKSKDKKYKVRF